MLLLSPYLKVRLLVLLSQGKDTEPVVEKCLRGHLEQRAEAAAVAAPDLRVVVAGMGLVWAYCLGSFSFI